MRRIYPHAESAAHEIDRGQPAAELDYWPVPDSVAVWGLPGALSAIRKVAVKAPARLGAKLTLMVQVAPAAKVAPQV